MSLSMSSVAVASPAEPTPRLSPIDTYAGFWLAVLRTMFRWMFGKVMLPLRIIFPRIPGYAFPHMCVMAFATRGISLAPLLVHVLSIRVSRNNACHFCFDMHKAAFMMEKPDPEALTFATRELDDPALDAKVRAVMAYADEVVKQGNVSDATFDQLKAQLPERQVVEVVWVAAFVIYTNMLARPLALPSDGFCAIVNRQKPVST